MKKITVLFLLFILFIITSRMSFAEAMILNYDGANHQYNSSIDGIRINGQIVETDIPPVLINDRSLVPVRAVFESLGAEVSWDAKEKQVTVAMGSKSIKLVINNENAIVNNKQVVMDVPAKIINNRTMVPLRFVGEQLNMNVQWLPDERLVAIDKFDMSKFIGIKTNINAEQEEIHIQLDKNQGYRDFLLKPIENNQNYRLVVDLSNVYTEEKGTIETQNLLSKSIRYAQFDKTTTRLVLDFPKEPVYEISDEDGGYIVVVKNNTQIKDKSEVDEKVTSQEDEPDINSEEISDNINDDKDTNSKEMIDGEDTNNSVSEEDTIKKLLESIDRKIEYKNVNNVGVFSITALNIRKMSEEYSGLVSQKYDDDGKKYTISFLNNSKYFEDKVIEINDGILEKINVINDEDEDLTRIEFYSKEVLVYELQPDTAYDTMMLIKNKNAEVDRGSDSRDNPLNQIKIGYKSTSSEESIIVYADNYNNYNIFRLTDENRIVIDIPNLGAPKTQEVMKINSSLIEKVRYAQFEKSTARIVIETNDQPDYSVEEKKGAFIVTFKKPAYKNIIYHSGGDRIYFELIGAKLTEGGEKLKNSYTGKFISDTKYQVSFDSDLADIGYGTFKINDGVVNTIEIDDNEETKQTNIIFNTKLKVDYEIITNSDVKSTNITLLEPYSIKDRLVVIDAGHGGKEVGAVYGDCFEKDLNLDIALRLNELLKSKGINTYMTREDDSFVGLYERAYIANTLNASLFLSIHNNAVDNKDVKGTMTLYYPDGVSKNGVDGKEFAQIIQNSLLDNLGTVDKKIIERPNLVVLKATTMPSALAEVSFMTNESDLNNLKDPEYRQKAAQALFEGILKTLEKME